MLLIVFALAFVAAAGPLSAHRILGLFPYPGKSHQMVFEPLLTELANRGHELTVVSFFPQKQHKNNYRDVSLVGLSEIHLSSVDLNNFELNYFGLERYFYHVPLVMGLARLNLKLCEDLVDWPAFQEFFTTNQTYDIILMEHFNSDCMLGLAHKYKVPFVGLMSSGMLPWTGERIGVIDNPAYQPGMTLPFTEKMTLLERFENAFYLYFYKLWFAHAIRSKEQAILERKFGEVIPDLGEISKNTSVVLINTHYTLTGIRPTVPGLIEVGGMHLKKTIDPLPTNLERYMNESEYGVILFSMGSLIRGSTMPRRKIDAFLKVFSKLPQRIIWKWEDENLPGVPDNVLIVNWLPQFEILHHPKCVAFISHGGLLSMTEAVHAGVPMVVVPILGDQFSNAAAASEAGFATVLDYGRIDEASLDAALQTVLDPESRTKASLVSLEWHDRPQDPLETAVYWVERVARFGHSGRSMLSHARHLPAYQLANLDLIGIAATLVAAIIIILYVAIKMIVAATTKIRFGKIKKS